MTYSRRCKRSASLKTVRLCKLACALKPPQNNLNFQKKEREKPGRKEKNSVFWDAVLRLPVYGRVQASGQSLRWERARSPRLARPQSAPKGQRVRGAPRSPLRGLGAALPSAAVSFPSLPGVWNAVGLKEGDREGTLQAPLTSALRIAPWIQNLTRLRDSGQFPPPLPRRLRLPAAHWLLPTLCPAPSGWGSRRFPHLLLADWLCKKSRS